jgi:hypothetical protein
MSGTTAPTEAQVALASYDQMLADTGLALAETRKFAAEQNKLAAEQGKLNAEARKLDRDRWLAPALAITGLIGGVLTVAVTIARAVGWLP